MGVSLLPQERISERSRLLMSLKCLVNKDIFTDDDEAFALWLDVVRILSYRASHQAEMGAPLKAVYRHFNRKFEVDYVEAQWDLIEKLEGAELSIVSR